MLCGQASAVKRLGDQIVAVSLPCRSWQCQDCAPKRRAQLIAIACAGDPNRLITLTVSPKIGTSPNERAKLLARAWRLVVARAQRQLHIPHLDYLAVCEATKRGEPHLHILVRSGFIPQRWLSAQMREILDSPIVDIRKVSNGRLAAAYVSKYIGKDPQRFGTCKRYWQTKKWIIQDDENNTEPPWGRGGWERQAIPLSGILSEWETNRYVITRSDKDIATCAIPYWHRDAHGPPEPPPRIVYSLRHQPRWRGRADLSVQWSSHSVGLSVCLS